MAGEKGGTVCECVSGAQVGRGGRGTNLARGSDSAQGSWEGPTGANREGPGGGAPDLHGAAGAAAEGRRVAASQVF